MRIDIVTIFPEFFSVLDVSLLGKARQSGLIDLGVHDLRDYTHDRHRTVDDTPYGGGAGMVMRPEPWGEALDSILYAPRRRRTPPVVIFPSPAGELFTQATRPPSSPASRTWCSAAGATRASTSASSTTPRTARQGAHRSAWATTCSTAARSPPWR